MRHAAASLLALVALSVPVAAQEEEPHLERALRAEVVLSFYRTPLEDVLDALRSAAKLNVVVGPEVNAKALLVTAEAEGETVAHLLDRIQARLGLQRATWCDAVVLHQPATPPGPEPTAGIGKEELAQRLSVNFVRTPAPIAFERLEQRSGITLRIPSDVADALLREGVTADLRLWEAQVRCILTHLTRSLGLTWRVDGDAIAVALAEQRQRDVDVETLPGVDFTGDIGEQVPQADVSRLLAQLAEPATREQASRRLQTVPGSAPQVARLLTESDSDTVLAALQVLEKTATAREVPAVLSVFQDEERSLEVRTVAARLLGHLKAESAIPALVEALDDQWFKISETARRALVEIGAPVVAPLERAYRAELAKRSARREGIVYRGLLVFGGIGGETTRSVLLDALQRRSRGDVAIRHHAAIGLGFTRDVEVVEPMIRAMSEEREFRVAKYIARSLGWILEAHGVKTPDLAPRGELWIDWWRRNKEQVLADKPDDDTLFEPLEPDFGTLPKLDDEKKD